MSPFWFRGEPVPLFEVPQLLHRTLYRVGLGLGQYIQLYHSFPWHGRRCWSRPQKR